MIKLSTYFTNHLNDIIKLDDNIVTTGSIETSINKLYSAFVFTTQDIYYDPHIVGDLSKRIRVRYVANDGDEINLYFVIDSIEYLDDNNIKVYCKSEGIRYAEKYSGVLNDITQVSTLKTFIATLIPLSNVENLTDVQFDFDYTIDKKSVEDVINDLCKSFGFEYYVKNDVIYFTDKKTIQNDIPLTTFNSISDIMSLSTVTNTDNKLIGKININVKKTDDIYAVPKLNLEIKDSPQCCSPDEVLIYTDTNSNTTYRINPVNAYWLLYYTPLTQDPICNIQHEKGEREVVEHFDLKDDDFVVLVGGIKEIVAISGVNNPTFVNGYNVLAFDEVVSGTLDITYKTDVLYGTIKHNETPKKVRFNVTHYNQNIDYIHEIKLNGYYPLSYNLKVNLMKDWGLDYDKAINKTITLSKDDDTGVFVTVTTYTSDSFGNFTLPISAYAHYKLSTSDATDLHLDYFVNNMKFFMSDKSNG